MSGQGAIFTAGPPVVKESTGEDISKEDLGGPDVALPSGVIHNVAEDDEAVLDDIRRYLSYFPSSAWSYPPTAAPTTRTASRVRPRSCWTSSPATTAASTTCARCSTWSSTGRTGSKCSRGSAGRSSARWPISAAIRWRSSPTSRQVLAGSIDADAADKAAHFIMVADSFHLPIVFLADNPGMLPGSRSERSGVLRSGARMFAAQTAATTLKLHVTLRKAYGFGSMVMSLLGFDDQSRDVRLPRRHDGRDERGGAEPGVACR